MFAFAQVCALWDQNPCSINSYSSCMNPAGPPAPPSCRTVLILFNQIAISYRFNDGVQEQDHQKQELDRTKQELDRAKQELQAQLAAAQNSLRASERSCQYYQAQLQQVGLPLCSAGQCWAGSLL